jgi:hypothetical protein
MGREVFLPIMAVVFALQLLLCFRVKRVIVKLIPLLAVLLLMAFCIINYALSGWNNWAFLILVLFLSMPIGAIAAGWLVYGMARLIKKISM